MKHSDPLIKNIKQTLDQQTLDADTRQKLAQARAQALQPAQPWWRLNYLVPAMVMASVLAVVLLLNVQPGDQATDYRADSIESFELLSSSDDIEMYQDLDFYIWLEQEPLG
jgi:hypothetical protein